MTKQACGVRILVSLALLCQWQEIAQTGCFLVREDQLNFTELSEWAARALYFLGTEYLQQGNIDAAKSTFQESIDRFGGATDPAVFEWASQARSRLGSL
jgi:hypothetical protein